MKLRVLVAIVTLATAAPAFAECSDDLCGSIQKILAARAGNFSKFKGKPARDPRGDPVWEGIQEISGLSAHASSTNAAKALTMSITARPPGSERSQP